MGYQAQYEAKKCTPEQAVSLIQNDDAVLVAGEPGALLEALYKARTRFDGLRLYSVFGFTGRMGADFHTGSEAGHILVQSLVVGRNEWGAWQGGAIDQGMVNLSDAEAYLENVCQPTVLLIHCPPMDDDGYFYPGVNPGCGAAALTRGAKVVIQVNAHLPIIHTDCPRIHIGSVAALCESAEPIPFIGPWDSEPTELDKSIAGFVAEIIPHGATIQSGLGMLPDLTCRYLENHKDLGIHTDCFSDAHLHLIGKGAVNNSKKEVLHGLSVGGYFNVSQENYHAIQNNPAVMMKSLSWVCEPATVRQISNMMTINTGICMDFRAQICAASPGMHFSGGVGSHLDFARGAKRSAGGKSFILMRSTFLDEEGNLQSSIRPALPEGSLVNIPRSDVMYVVTEYGAADFRDLSVKGRVEAMIALAHPDFREQLTDVAKMHGFANA
ncbi:MAG: hypothetical protein FWF83_02990 [Clostridiales bacterium]|nr:hypothetical protein [Clostridiales bacterium]